MKPIPTMPPPYRTGPSPAVPTVPAPSQPVRTVLGEALQFLSALETAKGLADQPRPRLETQAPSPAPAPTAKLLVTVEEGARQLSIGRPKMWQLVMTGAVLSIKIGASRRIPTAALEAYVTRLSAEAAEAAERRHTDGDTRQT